MLIEKDNIKCETTFSEDKSHRLLWKRVWNKEKPCLAIIMINPCLSDNIVTDTTTSLCLNNVARMEEYGGIHILNLFTLCTNKLCFRYNSDEDLIHKDNDSYIVKSAQECSKVILAWGRTESTNQRVGDRAAKVVELLSAYADKLYCISDGQRKGLHPLTPSIRANWSLERFELVPKDEAK